MLMLNFIGHWTLLTHRTVFTIELTSSWILSSKKGAKLLLKYYILPIFKRQKADFSNFYSWIFTMMQAVCREGLISLPVEMLSYKVNRLDFKNHELARLFTGIMSILLALFVPNLSKFPNLSTISSIPTTPIFHGYHFRCWHLVCVSENLRHRK